MANLGQCWVKGQKKIPASPYFTRVCGVVLLFKLDFVRLIFSIFFHIKYYSPCLFGLKICIIYIYLNY